MLQLPVRAIIAICLRHILPSARESRSTVRPWLSWRISAQLVWRLACGHEFTVMDGGYIPNAPVRCPKCGSDAIRTESSSMIKTLLDAVFGKRKKNI